MDPEPTVAYLIDSVRGRPLAFLEALSFREFTTFLGGYLFGLDVAIPGGFLQGSEMKGFQLWVSEKLGTSPKWGWIRAILHSVDDDDEAAFHRFFELWDEFVASHPT